MLLLIAITAIGIWGYYSRKAHKKIINALESISSQQVTKLEVYPRVSYGAFGVPVTFIAPDQIIGDFLQTVMDRQSYPTSRDRVDSENNCWFLEITTKDTSVQMSFYIPSQKRGIVVGRLGKFPENGARYYYGDFQSRQLYHWYQKYSHRWLEPEKTPPIPSPQPHPPGGE